MPSWWPPWGLVGAQWDLERDRVVRAVASWGSGSEACSGPWGLGELGAARRVLEPGRGRLRRARRSLGGGHGLGGSVPRLKRPAVLPVPAGSRFYAALLWGQARG